MPQQDTYVFSGKTLLEIIKTFIRYDIPILELGKSSIGKSHSLIEMGNMYRIPHQLLYVGSEKPEHIEGLPKLTGLSEQATTLEYLRPYWFPNGTLITNYVLEGRKKFQDFIDNYLDDKSAFNYDYQNLNMILEALANFTWEMNEKSAQLLLKDKQNLRIGESAKAINTKPFPVEREIVTEKTDEYKRDDVRDICVYICTLMGYGNFWLMLDEIDKVDEYDIDKYAPLLHIVRERWLKNWNLREINNRKGINVPELVKASDYSKVKEIVDSNLDNGQSVLDTRIIAIANSTSKLEEALFRRFVQLIIEDVMVLKPVSDRLSSIKRCVDSNDDLKIVTDLVSGLRLQRLKEINLQWLYNFLPKILNRTDLIGNFFFQDYMQMRKNIGIDPNKQKVEYELKFNELKKTTALWKVLRDNFEEGILGSLFSCLIVQFEIQEKDEKKDRTGMDKVRAHLAEMSKEEYSPQEMRDEIIANLRDSYPQGGKMGSKLIDAKDWAKEAYMYIEATMIDANGGFFQLDVNKLLIPSVHKLIIEMTVNDSDLNEDNQKAIFDDINKFWVKIEEENKINPEKLTADAIETQIALYGASKNDMDAMGNDGKVKKSKNALFGAMPYITDKDTSDEAYRESVSFALSVKNKSSMMLFLSQNLQAGNLSAITSKPEMVSFIKENLMDVVNDYVKQNISSSDKKKKEVAEKMKEIFK
jgi:hypothetical protein